MIKYTIGLLRIFIVAPLGVALGEKISSLPPVKMLVVTYIPFDSISLVVTGLFVLLFGFLALRVGSTFTCWLFLLGYTLPSILTQGVLMTIFRQMGIEFRIWNIDILYLIYASTVIVFSSMLDRTYRRIKKLEKWGVQNFEEALYYLLGSESFIIFGALFLVLFVVSELNVRTWIFSSYALPLIFLLLAFLLVWVVTPEKTETTVAVVKVMLDDIGTEYAFSVSQEGEDIIVEIRDSGVISKREILLSFELPTPPSSILIKHGISKERLEKRIESVIDGRRYVFYSNESFSRI